MPESESKPSGKFSNTDSWVARFIKGTLPILVCIGLIGMARKSSQGDFIVVCVACAVVLWFGWSPVRHSKLIKWVASILSAYLALILGLFALAMTIRLSLLLLPVFLIMLPLVVYDLFFRARSQQKSENDSTLPASE